jgi:REP element-mobilizing transposase RayT
MPQSLSQVIVHFIFSTKNRRRLIDADARPRLHAYLATVCRDHKCEVFRVGGTEDHVHIATALGRTISQSELIERIKTASSKWIKELNAKHFDFEWQHGYGAFSVSQSHLDKLIHYIDAQEEHHRTRTFEEEYRQFLEKYGIKYDERYVWD